MTSVLLGLGVAAAAMLIVAVWRGLAMKRLANEGTSVTGRVLKVWGHTGASRVKTHRLRYGFDAADGRRYERSVMVAPSEREPLSEGSPVEVVYLPDNPKVSALGSVVGQARQALQRR